jgi:hypothetical protein
MALMGCSILLAQVDSGGAGAFTRIIPLRGILARRELAEMWCARRELAEMRCARRELVPRFNVLPIPLELSWTTAHSQVRSS